MPEVEVPVVGTEIDTSDPADTATSLGLGVVAIAVLLAMVGAGEFIFNRAKNLVGIDEQSNIPGV